MGDRPRNIYNTATKKEKSKELRNEGTAAEAVLWKHLQRRQILGKKFRRRYSIGSYIVDFYCPECSLVIELDGAPHFSPLADEYEAERTRYLKNLGLRIIRFENKTLYNNEKFVLETIREAVQKTGTS